MHRASTLVRVRRCLASPLVVMKFAAFSLSFALAWASLPSSAAADPGSAGDERSEQPSRRTPFPGITRGWIDRRPAVIWRQQATRAALPRWYGTTIALGGGLSAGLAWATTLTRIALARCDGADALRAGACAPSDALLAPLGGLGDLGAWRAASVGARMVGHRDALVYPEDSHRPRATAPYLASGITLLVLGVGTWFGTQRMVAARACHDASSCTRLHRSALVGGQFGNSLMAAGGGLFAYGLAYQRANRRLRRGSPIGHLRMQADLDPTYAGLLLRGRF